MKLHFYKYQGTGNDFVIIDNRSGMLKENNYKLWAKLCDRRFGIGADGLMLLQTKKGYDFEMYYVNADGKPTSMCGNGGRCITHFAKKMDLFHGDKAHFLAIDGSHEAIIKDDTVKLKMKDVSEIKMKVESDKNACVLNTGSPHYIAFVNNAMKTDVFTQGRQIRNSKPFKKEGINVNFIELRKKDIPLLRTYERGVEDETLSCGTGTVAAALVLAAKGKSTTADHCDIQTMGGKLKVWFKKDKKGFKDVWLEGPATLVYEGEVDV